MLARVTHAAVHMLDWLAERTLAADPRPAHQRIGQRGEEEAYFHLRKLGYVMVARNFRSPRRRGEIDLIGWDKDVLCFIEVKTRTTRDVKPADGRFPQETRIGRYGAGVSAAISHRSTVALGRGERVLSWSTFPATV